MFKRFLIVLTVCFQLIPAFGAYADVIAKPDNDFFNRYGSECVYLGRTFYVNGEDGSASVKSAPGSVNGPDVIENGEILYVEYSCLYKGEYWGLASFYQKDHSGGGKHYGWIKMDQLLVRYDYVSFEEAHLEALHPYNGDYDEIKKAGAAIAWPWPGADSPVWTVEDLDTANFRVSCAYTDEQGREWGFVSYLYGNQNTWICLSDPLNRNIPVFTPEPEPTQWISDTVHTDIGNVGNPIYWLIVILVAGLAAGTVILIRIFWDQNKTGGEISD